MRISCANLIRTLIFLVKCYHGFHLSVMLYDKYDLFNNWEIWLGLKKKRWNVWGLGKYAFGTAPINPHIGIRHFTIWRKSEVNLDDVSEPMFIHKGEYSMPTGTTQENPGKYKYRISRGCINTGLQVKESIITLWELLLEETNKDRRRLLFLADQNIYFSETNFSFQKLYKKEVHDLILEIGS